MTEYFDTKIEALSLLKRVNAVDVFGDLGVWQGPVLAKRIKQIDIEIVCDVSVCSGFEGFPGDIRDRINEIVCKYSTECQPVNGRDPSYETYEEHVRNLIEMVDKLHTCFHNLAERRLTCGWFPCLFGDDPRTPIRVLYSRAEEKREHYLADRGTEERHDPAL